MDAEKIISVKTPGAFTDGEPLNRSVQISMHLAEAFETLHAVERAYRDRSSWGHDMGPPRVRDLISTLREAIGQADPDYAKLMFDAPVKDYTPPGSSPIVREVHHHHYYPRSPFPRANGGR